MGFDAEISRNGASTKPMSHPVAIWMSNPFALSSFFCWCFPYNIRFFKFIKILIEIDRALFLGSSGCPFSFLIKKISFFFKFKPLCFEYQLDINE
jgi:hypothetical protein